MIVCLPGRVVDVSAQLAVPGEHLQRPGHPAPTARRGQDVHPGGQVLQGHHEEGTQGLGSRAMGSLYSAESGLGNSAHMNNVGCFC
jgi:hypothetical protein